MTSKKIFAGSVLVLLLGLILGFPARNLLGLVGSAGGSQPLVAASKVTGPWYAGKADLLSINNQNMVLQFSDVSWRLRGLALLRGRLLFDVGALFDGSPITFQGGASVIGNVIVEKLSAQADLASLQPLLQNLLFPLYGTVQLNNVDLVLADNWPTDAKGDIYLEALQLELPLAPLLIGDLQLALLQREADGLLELQIIENTGDLQLSGGATISAARQYQLELLSEPAPTFDPMLRQQLKQFLQSPTDQRFQLSYGGQL